MTKWPYPGEEKWQDLSLATQRQHFSLRALAFCAVRTGGKLKEGKFPLGRLRQTVATLDP